MHLANCNLSSMTKKSELYGRPIKYKSFWDLIFY
uniref:Uncharacterized protein n=1 Tax=Rhizophora mucronata TaxID=61149 RepID=A0A2P2P7T6_RHIMU